MSPLSAILVLWDIWIHIHSSDSSDMSSYVKTHINQPFTVFITLSVPNINPNNCHVTPGGSLDNSWFQCK